MRNVSKSKRYLHAIYNALIPFHILAGIFMLPAIGFCTDADTQAIVEQAAEKAAEKAVKKVVENAAEKTTAEVVDQAADRAMEKTAQEETEKQELKAKRPDEWRGPTKVHFVLFVLDVDSIDDANQSFMTNVYIKLRWEDRRLANPEGSTRQMPLGEVWNPQLILGNRQGLVSRSLSEVVQVDPDGTVTYRQRYSGMLSQPLQLANFPMDKHTFTIHFISAAYSTKELEFVPDTSKYDSRLIGGSMADELSLPDWKVTTFEALALPYQPIREVHQAGFAFRFKAERYIVYYLWQILFPLFVVVAMSWSSFWIQRSQAGVRIGVATSAILTLITYRFILANLLPRLPYMTHLDYFTVGSTLLVFLALLGVVATSYLAAINRSLMAKHLDLWARSLFPVFFLLLLGWFFFG
ncbi:MAG: hypothetical protein ACI9MF_002383 [Gammaproteobacteria bacterium]|jgi:hypothetical protein